MPKRTHRRPCLIDLSRLGQAGAQEAVPGQEPAPYLHRLPRPFGGFEISASKIMDCSYAGELEGAPWIVRAGPQLSRQLETGQGLL